MRVVPHRDPPTVPGQQLCTFSSSTQEPRALDAPPTHGRQSATTSQDDRVSRAMQPCQFLPPCLNVHLYLAAVFEQVASRMLRLDTPVYSVLRQLPTPHTTRRSRPVHHELSAPVLASSLPLPLQRSAAPGMVSRWMGCISKGGLAMCAACSHLVAYLLSQSLPS